MLVSLSTGSLYFYPLRWTFALAKRTGFDGVELVIGPEVDLRGAAYVKQLSQEYQLPVLTVHPPLFGYRGWEEINENYAPYMEKAVELTQSVGAKLMVVHPPRAYRYDDEEGQRFVKGVVTARNSINGKGPLLGVENGAKFTGRDETYILRALPELREFADKHDFAMTLDTAHIGTFELDLLASLEFFDGRVANVHLSDLRDVPHWLLNQPRLHSYYRQHQLPGTGTLPLRALLRELKQRGYNGTVTYELSPLAVDALTPWRVEKKLRAAVEFVREAIR
ncbi:MAG TPA: sugar phosphate isomerase/epimerase family protein [Anaerolineae bacterium]|nr:sugar phosphate isomerase/epimerase family protein [Anaerolineae bacterium]